MNGVFLDAVGLIALANRADQWNALATQVFKQLALDGRQLLTSSLVLIEVGDGLSRVHFRELAVRIRISLLRSNRVEVIQSNDDLERRAWDLYAERPDKDWGMTDCDDMTIMQDRGLRTVMTADRHFEQAGYEILLKT